MDNIVMNHDLPALIEAAMRNGDLAIEVYAVSPSGVAVPIGDVVKIDWPVVVRPVVKGSNAYEGVISNS